MEVFVASAVPTASPPPWLPPHQKNLITPVSCQGPCNNPPTTHALSNSFTSSPFSPLPLVTFCLQTRLSFFKFYPTAVTAV